MNVATALTAEAIDTMDRADLRAALKVRSLKYSKLSVLQQRDLLKANKEVPKPSVKAFRDGKPRPSSKVEKCLKLYEENKDKSRKELIEIFIKKGGLTSPAAASTYLFNIKKKYVKK